MSGTAVGPILLPSNQPPARFYRGGRRISEFRHELPSPPNTPEDWVGSTTSVRGNAPVGMTRLGDGTLLADAIASDPKSWLGSDHVARFGIDTMLLVKLLDAGQRLPVHAHPDASFAARHISATHGKAEAWYILTPGVVHLGLNQSVTLEQLGALVAQQDTAALLALTHGVPVEPGDTVFVPPGVLHAIGEGILLVEVQEPEDLSILLEWKGFDLDGEHDGHLGLGFELALKAVEIHARSRDEIDSLVRRAPPPGSVLSAESEAFFRLDRVHSRADFPAGFSIIIALDTAANLTLASGAEMPLHPGSTTLVPHVSGSFRVGGDALVARPPAGS